MLPHLPSRFLLIATALLGLSAPSVLRSEIVFQRPAAGSDTVVAAPYPAPGTNLLSWLSAGSPGAWIATFEPTTNEIIRSVTIEMADAVTGSEPLAGDAPEGGFSLNLCQITQSDSAVVSIEIVAVLEGSDNPAIEGSYTYTVPEGVELRGPHALLAMVEPSGGHFRWKRGLLGAFIGTGIRGGFIVSPETGATISGTLDLENVVIFATDRFAPAFTVEADDRPADLTLTPVKPFAPTKVNDEAREQQIIVRNSGISLLTGLVVRGDAEARRHYKFRQPGSRTLTAGATTEFPVSFRPRESGRISGVLTVVSSGGTAKVRLRGRGVTPPVQPPVREPRDVE